MLMAYNYDADHCCWYIVPSLASSNFIHIILSIDMTKPIAARTVTEHGQVARPV